MKYDLLIPLALPEILFVKKSLPYIIPNLKGVETIYLVTKGKYIKKLETEIKGFSSCKIINEESLIQGVNFNSVKGSLHKKYGNHNMRTGWYFQQFLKLGFASSSYCKNYYLSWDADTIPLHEIDFFDKNGKPFFAMKHEYNKPYFITIKNLLGIERQVEFSYIAEHMLFKKEYVLELINAINQSKISGKYWFEKIINATDYEASKRPEMFSEFETYGNFVEYCHHGSYSYRQLNTFREAGYISGRFINKRILSGMAFDLDTASFELQHSPVFPLNILHKLYRIYIKVLVKLYG